MGIVLRPTRTRQPQSAALIDWGNPLTRGLIALIDMRTGRDVLAPAWASTNTTTIGPGVPGVGAGFASGTYAAWPFATGRAKISGQLSVGLLLDHAPSGAPNSFLLGDVQAGGTGYNWGLYSNTVVFSMFVKTGGSGTSAAGTSSSAGARPNTRLVGTYDGANIRIFVNGTQEGSAAKTGTVDSGAFDLHLNRWNSSSAHTGRGFLAPVWNRALSAAEVAQWSANPWQLFEPAPRRLWAPSVGAGGTVDVGQASETDEALALGANLTAAVGQASETDTALAISATLAVLVGQVSETDAAQPLASNLTVAVGQVAEADEALAITTGAQIDVGQVSETDSALALTASHSLAIGLVTETDTALPVLSGAVAPVGLVEETDTAQPIAISQALSIGMVTETGSALPITVDDGTAEIARRVITDPLGGGNGRRRRAYEDDDQLDRQRLIRNNNLTLQLMAAIVASGALD